MERKSDEDSKRIELIYIYIYIDRARQAEHPFQNRINFNKLTLLKTRIGASQLSFSIMYCLMWIANSDSFSMIQFNSIQMELFGFHLIIMETTSSDLVCCCNLFFSLRLSFFQFSQFVAHCGSVRVCVCACIRMHNLIPVVNGAQFKISNLLRQSGVQLWFAHSFAGPLLWIINSSYSL